MKKSILFKFILMIFVFPIQLFGQIKVDFQLFMPKEGIVFLNDLNFGNLGNAPLLFTVKIDNYYPESKKIYLRFGIIKDNQITLIDGITDPFIIAPFPETIFLTSQNILSEGDKYSIQDVSLSDEAEDLKNVIYASGKLPVGDYQFFVEVYFYENNGLADDGSDEIKIVALTTIDLISPGQPAEHGDVIETFTTLPFFLWHSTAVKFRITICEKLPTNSSPADVMNNEPRMQAIIDVLTFFPYPSSAVRPLQPGKTYYWQIVAITESSDGPVELESEIWGFKISNLVGGMFSMEHQQILAYLTSFFGGRGLADLFEPGGELDGFTFTGAMFNNGAPMTYEDLNTFIEQIIDNRIAIDEHFVE